MPVGLLLALVASLGFHLAVLLGPEIDLSPAPTKAPILAELRPLPRSDLPVNAKPPLPPRRAAPVSPPPPKKRAATKHTQPKTADRVARTSPVLALPQPAPETFPVAPSEAPPAPALETVSDEEPVASAQAAEAVTSRLPVNGVIDYRVDRGELNFEIGRAQHRWEIADGHYRLTSVVETTGLVRLLKSININMESRGRITPGGLQPDFFVIQRTNGETKEKVFFDWETKRARVGEKGDLALPPGTQDLLSFNYQLGFMAPIKGGGTLPVATGRKLSVYRLETVGDEEIETPAGTMNTLHLRAPDDNTTDLWLAYAYRLLPVKIRYTDKKGDILVQVATHIQLSPD